MSYKVGVVGAAGYAGIEAARLVLNHPEFQLKVVTSNADAGDSLIGTLAYVDDSTENVLFSVSKPGGGEVLIPASGDFIVSVDPEGRKIRVSLPEGLLDLG